jgi:hypothetical protein
MNFVLSSGRLHRAWRASAVGNPYRRRSHFIHISASDSHLDSLSRVSWGVVEFELRVLKCDVNSSFALP